MKLRLLFLTFLFSALSWGQTPWINELHYDDVNTDSAEGVEIAIPTGSTCTTIDVVAYNGNGGASYLTVTNILANPDCSPSTSNGVTFYWVDMVGLQNGAPDGVALVCDGVAIQFLSYEGSFTATDGPADGMTSVDIGVSENGVTDGFSLQLQGSGGQYSDFTWTTSAIASTSCSVNTGQTITSSGNLITVTQATGGTITPGTTSVADGNDQAFTAAADACYTFTNWVVDGVNAGNANTYTFTNVTANHAITAVYTQDTYSITATAGANGSISPSGTSVVNCGDDLSYTFTPDSGYAVQDVLVDGVSVGAVTSYDFTNVTGNHTISVSFMVYVGPCVDEGFDSGTTAPSGWTFNSIGGTYTSAGNFGNSSPSLKLDDTGDAITTSTFTNATELSFWLKGQGTNATSSLLIEGFNGGWVTIDNISNLPTTGTTYTYNSGTTPALPTNITQFRFTYTKSSGNLSFDDVYVICGAPVDNEIDVEGNSVSIVSGDTTPSITDDTDFGTTIVGNDVSHTFTITNAGPDDLDISGITITGVDAADFYVSINPGSVVGAGGSTTFEVTFSPSAAGTSNATINIANNDSDENPYTFDIVAVSTVCVPTTSVSSISPSSGPAGTVVTINGSGFATATSVSFGAYAASYTVVSGSVIEAVVPAGAASGDIIIEDAGCELSFPTFTVVKEDNTDCEGIAITTDLIIYDLHDEKTGNGGFITIYNGTASDVDLADYTLWRTSNYGDGGEIDYANLTGILASGDLGVIRVNTAGCGPVATNGTIDNGFNEDDQIQLRDATGTVVIDDVHTYVPDAGYYMVRNTGALSARTSYVAADWSITPLAAGECWPSAGLVLPSGNGNSPDVTLNPVDVNASCTSSTATLTVAGTEGVAGGAGLAYQWYVNVPGTAGWTAVSNGGVYSGATSATLNISSTSGLNNYQYYCQIREDNATCFTATEAAIIKDGATVWNGSSWSNGVPNIGMLAVIDGNYDTALHGDFSCCSLIVNATYTLDIQANNYVEIQNDLTVNGTLNVWDDGSLVQIDDAGVNTGDINYERITTGVALDYVYWSSPVDGVNTPATGHIYIWDADFANPNTGWGYWLLARNTVMAPGVGYIMRDVFTRTFTGVARNGVIQPSISRANYTDPDFLGNNNVTITKFDDNWNLVGNPYPSAIRALDFLNANPNIEGAVRIWTHGTSPAVTTQPVYDSFVYNYTVNDYIVFNATGPQTGPETFNGFIAGGQSFMINMDDGAAATETVTFNNAMRNRTHNNEQFYRQASPSNKSVTTTEKHRIWLDLANDQNNSTRTLVGYITDATNGKDRMFDAVTNAQANEMGIYSIINNERMLIQGRTLPFDNQDKVQLAVNIPSSGTYSIGLSALDGLFNGSQDIYLEDLMLGIIHDLRVMPYSFQAQKGEFKNRFVLRYTNETLSEEEVVSSNDIVIATLENGFNIVSNKQKIKSVTIHNVLGQIVFERKNVNSNEIQVSEILKNNQALILNLVLDNNIEITKKVIF